MSDLQTPQIKHVYSFCFHGIRTDRQRFYKNTAMSKQIILLPQT